MRRWKIFYVKIRLNMWEDPNNLFDFHLLLNLKGEHWVTYVIAQSGRLIPLRSRAESFPFSFLHRALTMSPEQSQYIWRKTIPHIEVGMGSGVFTSHRSARFLFLSDWWTRRKIELFFFYYSAQASNGFSALTRPDVLAGPWKRAFPSRRIQSSHRFPYGYLVTTSPQSKTPPWYAPIRPPKAFVALVVHRSHGWSLVRCFGRNQFPGCDGRCVQGPGTYSPRHADPRLLAIPTSCSRVAENNPNWGNLSGFAPPYSLASHCNCHCSTCVAQPIRAMRTWRHPHLPPVYHWQSLVSAARTFFFVSEPFWRGVLLPLRTTPANEGASVGDPKGANEGWEPSGSKAGVR